MKKSVIIVAGGKGLRMGSDIPKQFIPIGEGKDSKPILMWTMLLFRDIVDSIILVLPEDYISYWERLCREYYFSCSHTIAIAGLTRFHSVQSGLRYVEKGSLIAIHDAVRPFVSKTLIQNLYQCAEEYSSAIPYIDMVDSIRRTDKERDKSTIVDRNCYICVQTPQVFKSDVILESYSVPFEDSFTDDASVYEYYTQKSVHLLLGERKNIKITTAMDLDIAQIFIKKS